MSNESVTDMTDQLAPPQLLLIVQEQLRPGAEEPYSRLESQIADLCARLHCPNPYLALQSLDVPTRVWWLNSFLSDGDQERVDREYGENKTLTSELIRLSRRKGELTFGFTTDLVRYRPDLSSGVVWAASGARFFVVTVGDDVRAEHGSVFESPDGQLYDFIPAATREQAERSASANAGASTVFAVRPGWSVPADAWVAADPEFWEEVAIMRESHIDAHL